MTNIESKLLSLASLIFGVLALGSISMGKSEAASLAIIIAVIYSTGANVIEALRRKK